MERPHRGTLTTVGRHANRRPARSNSVQPISPDIRHTASAAQDAGPADYPRFHAAVALAQLTSWLPTAPQLLIDISGPGSRAAEVAVSAGHNVLRVIDPEAPPPDAAPLGPTAHLPGGRPRDRARGGSPPGRESGGRESLRPGSRPRESAPRAAGWSP